MPRVLFSPLMGFDGGRIWHWIHSVFRQQWWMKRGGNSSPLGLHLTGGRDKTLDHPTEEERSSSCILCSPFYSGDFEFCCARQNSLTTRIFLYADHRWQRWCPRQSQSFRSGRLGLLWWNQEGVEGVSSNDVYTCCKYYVLRPWQNVILRRLRVFYYCVALIIPLHD